MSHLLTAAICRVFKYTVWGSVWKKKFKNSFACISFGYASEAQIASHLKGITTKWLTNNGRLKVQCVIFWSIY